MSWQNGRLRYRAGYAQGPCHGGNIEGGRKKFNIQDLTPKLSKESIIWGKFLMESFEPPMEVKEKRLENLHATASSVCNWQSGGDVHNAASVMVPRNAGTKREQGESPWLPPQL